MTFAAWKSATKPKFEGSWNLHELLPPDLDFFILLSSLCGIIGQIGQANYAAGDTFEDTLARWHTSRGYRNSFSIDLGIVSDAGYFAKNEEIEEKLMNSGQFFKISRDELHHLLDRCCCVNTETAPVASNKRMTEKSQILVRLKPPRINLEGRQRLAPLFVRLRNEETSESVAIADPSPSKIPDLMNLKSRFLDASSPTDAALVVAYALRAKLARSLSTSSTSLLNHDIDIYKALLTYGVDSLLAVEVRNWLRREFAADVAAFEIIGGAIYIDIAQSVVSNSKFERITSIQ
jgi:hypothetical protein